MLIEKQAPISGVGEIDEQVRTLVAIVENSGSVSSIHMV